MRPIIFTFNTFLYCKKFNIFISKGSNKDPLSPPKGDKKKHKTQKKPKKKTKTPTKKTQKTQPKKKPTTKCGACGNGEK